MPLDGHAFLVNQGWSGAGTGLRKGAISRPITAPQKRNLAGVGKDRDEAFPFWDHLFTVASSAIQIECFSSDDDGDRPQSGIKDTRPSTSELRQTSTGILSNRPPIVGTPATSGTSTPALCSDRPSLLSLAKRETARRGLYSRFFRGPILGPDDIKHEMVKTEPTATSGMPSHLNEVEKCARKKRKIDVHGEDVPKALMDKEERKREKRLRKEAETAVRKLKRHKEKKHEAKDGDVSGSQPVDERASSPLQEKSFSTTPDETPRVRREKKKKKRRKGASVDDELDAKLLVSADGRTRRDSSNSSRKRRRRDQSP